MVQIFLETLIPLNYLAGQTLRFAELILASILATDEIRDFTNFVEWRAAVEYICCTFVQLQIKPDSGGRLSLGIERWRCMPSD